MERAVARRGPPLLGGAAPARRRPGGSAAIHRRALGYHFMEFRHFTNIS